MLQDNIRLLNNWIRECNNVVFFGGAGVSTESGIPDFRSVDGLYHTKYKYPPETILSHSFFMKNTKEFYKFYRDKMIYLNASPNITHIKLSEMESSGKLKGIITQNIDGLHQKAGSINVIELHGSILRNYCMQCGMVYEIEEILEGEEIPRCRCGGIIKPDVVLYEESLKEETIAEAIRLISHADVLIVGGTSLSVYPAAGMLHYYNGNKMVLVNKSPTQFDKSADLILQASLGEVFGQITL